MRAHRTSGQAPHSRLVFICAAFAGVLGSITSPVVAQTPAPSSATTATASGEFYVEPPTLENIGYEWRIEGDSNRNAKVDVTYRKLGDTPWKLALAPLRLDHEETKSPNGFSYVSPNMFAGSVFDLQPGTDYEVRAVLSDPDGVSGAKEHIAVVHTRPEPVPAEGGRVYHVYPYEYKGPRQEPSFNGLLGAYYEGDVGADHYNAFKVRVRPGDIILVHAGVYKDDRFHYGHELLSGWTQCCGTTGDGTYYLTGKGTVEKPIVIKGAGDGEAIFDGDGNNNLFNLLAADYHYFEGLTFRGTYLVFEAGFKDITGSKGLTIKHSKFYDIGIGVHTDYAGSKDFYIADNDFAGRHNAKDFWGFLGKWTKVPGFEENSRLLSQFAIKLYGSGHVIAYNKVRNFHDGIDHATYGDPKDYPNTTHEFEPSSIDIINNDIANVHDNCIEADGAMHNIRVMRNLCVNSGSQAYSFQPILGGPAYMIRNILYNSPFDSGLKTLDQPAGGILYNNTWFVSSAPGEKAFSSNGHFRNNLFLRQNPELPVFSLTTLTNYSSSDYNGFFAAPGGADPFQWNSPPMTVAKDVARAVEKRTFKTLADYVKATGQDAHSILIDYRAFANVPPVDPKAPLTTMYDGAKLDFRLAKNSPAIDRGVVLPNVTDGYSGKAPDLGAIEYGQPIPHYGPRP